MLLQNAPDFVLEIRQRRFLSSNYRLPSKVGALSNWYVQDRSGQL
jgi:hypothetical protein